MPRPLYRTTTSLSLRPPCGPSPFLCPLAPYSTILLDGSASFPSLKRRRSLVASSFGPQELKAYQTSPQVHSNPSPPASRSSKTATLNSSSRLLFLQVPRLWRARRQVVLQAKLYRPNRQGLQAPSFPSSGHDDTSARYGVRADVIRARAWGRAWMSRLADAKLAARQRSFPVQLPVVVRRGIDSWWMGSGVRAPDGGAFSSSSSAIMHASAFASARSVELGDLYIVASIHLFLLCFQLL